MTVYHANLNACCWYQEHTAKKVQMAIMSLCFFFNAISQKVIDEESLDELEKRQFETIVLLEA